MLVVRLTDRKSTFKYKNKEREMESAVWKYTMKYEVHGTWKESGDFKVSLLIPKKSWCTGYTTVFIRVP